MTKKPLDEMTNEEIRLEIAEQKGYENVRTWGIKNVLMVYGGQEPGLHHNLPNWPESIEAAWELVIDAQADPHLLYFGLNSTPAISDKWYAEIGGNFVRSATAPLAICKAWLAWKRSESNV